MKKITLLCVLLHIINLPAARFSSSSNEELDQEQRTRFMQAVCADSSDEEFYQEQSPEKAQTLYQEEQMRFKEDLAQLERNQKNIAEDIKTAAHLVSITLLMKAVQTKHNSWTQKELKNALDNKTLNKKDSQRRNALHYAAIIGNMFATHVLLSAGIETDLLSQTKSAAQLAHDHGYEDMARVIQKYQK
jgi:ankyrin repeat protein